MENLWTEISNWFSLNTWIQSVPTAIVGAIVFAMLTPLGKLLRVFANWILSSVSASYRRRRELRLKAREQEIEFLVAHADIRGEVMAEGVSWFVLGAVLFSYMPSPYIGTGFGQELLSVAFHALGLVVLIQGWRPYQIAREARERARTRLKSQANDPLIDVPNPT